MFDKLENLSKEFNVPFENVLSIALNRYGVIIPNFKDNRVRFNLKLLNSDVSCFYAVCVNTYMDSPFLLSDNNLFLGDKLIGNTLEIELDTCTSTYFRNDKKAITFNSNSRSKCVGCKFCGTYSLTDEDNLDFTTKDNIKKYFEDLLLSNDINSMNNIEEVTICTGCFPSEDDLINHLLLVNSSFSDMGYNGRLNYIGSQLRDYDKIKKLHNEVNDFGLFLTIEKFLEREKFMRMEKASLTIEKSKDLLSYCSSLGITTTFLYILGLEDLNTINKYFSYLSDSINKFPIVQVFQDYTPSQENYRCSQAKDIEYYLNAKKIINEIFKDKEMKPKLWECFRSLYYDDDTFKKEKMLCKKK
mgnify:FL=1